jgi:hypothetical protein
MSSVSDVDEKKKEICGKCYYHPIVITYVFFLSFCTFAHPSENTFFIYISIRRRKYYQEEDKMVSKGWRHAYRTKKCCQDEDIDGIFFVLKKME